MYQKSSFHSSLKRVLQCSTRTSPFVLVEAITRKIHWSSLSKAVLDNLCSLHRFTAGADFWVAVDSGDPWPIWINDLGMRALFASRPPPAHFWVLPSALLSSLCPFGPSSTSTQLVLEDEGHTPSADTWLVFLSLEWTSPTETPIPSPPSPTITWW